MKHLSVLAHNLLKCCFLNSIELDETLSTNERYSNNFQFYEHESKYQCNEGHSYTCSNGNNCKENAPKHCVGCCKRDVGQREEQVNKKEKVTKQGPRAYSFDQFQTGKRPKAYYVHFV